MDTIRKLIWPNKSITHLFDSMPRRILQKIISDIPGMRRNVTLEIKGKRGMGNLFHLINSKKIEKPPSEVFSSHSGPTTFFKPSRNN
jgi:hypothetical protein